ncbi:MAG: hypothetical protein ACRDBY_14170 [Cetobacterium sp.]
MEKGFIYCVSIEKSSWGDIKTGIKVEKVVVEKETPKQYRIGRNNIFRGIVNKNELDCIICGQGLFTTDLQKGIQIVEDCLKERLEKATREYKAYIELVGRINVAKHKNEEGVF